MGQFVFALLALVAVAGAVVVVAARRVVASALALVLCFLAVAGLFILQGAEFSGRSRSCSTLVRSSCSSCWS